MQEQLKVLKEIIDEEIAWYSVPYEYPSLFARFTQSSTNKVIDNHDWVCWVFENQQVTKEFIKTAFQQAFVNKEFFVHIGCSSGCSRKYISVTGKDITLENILSFTKELDTEKSEFKNKERFFEIVLERVRIAQITGTPKVICSNDDVADDELLEDISYVDWWLATQSKGAPPGRIYDDPALLLSELYQKINKQFPDEDFIIETSLEDKTLSIIFNNEDDE